MQYKNFVDLKNYLCIKYREKICKISSDYIFCYTYYIIYI